MRTSLALAYVFVRGAGGWTQQAYLKASNTQLGAFFGYTVAIANETVAIGAPMEGGDAAGIVGDPRFAGSGAVYLFRRAASAWSQEAYVKAANLGGAARFGHAVSLSGATLAVGAPQEASNARGVNGDASDRSLVSAGAGYVFAHGSSGWAQRAYVKASNTHVSQFGFSVALAGEELAVGAPSESSGATGVGGDQTSRSAGGAGAAYVYH